MLPVPRVLLGSARGRVDVSHQNGGGIVRGAVFKGCPDQRFTFGLYWLGFGENGRQLLLPGDTVKAVGAEQQKVAGREIDLVSLDFDIVRGSDGFGEDVAVGVCTELVVGQTESSADVVDPVVVGCHAVEFAAPLQVDSAVSHARNVRFRKFYQRRHHGRSHARVGGVFLSLGAYSGVGHLN